jgi:VanZ family protein
MAMIFWLSSLPDIPGPNLFSFQDKVEHFLVYGILAVFVSGALGARDRGPGWAKVVLVTTVVALYGALDEFHQMFVPGRDASLMDLFFDTLGAFSFVCLYRHVYVHLQHQLSRP